MGTVAVSRPLGCARGRPVLLCQTTSRLDMSASTTEPRRSRSKLSHEAWVEANFLKSLFEDICRMRFRHTDNQPMFKWKTYVIGYPTSVAECKLGEELFCRLTVSYYITGIGFNIGPAGLSIQSATALTDDSWLRFPNIREKNALYVQQLTQEVDEDLPRYVTRGPQQQAKQMSRRNMFIKNRAQLVHENKELRYAISKQQTTDMVQNLREKQRELQDTYKDSQQELQALTKRHHKDIMGHVTSMAKCIYNGSDTEELEEEREGGLISR